MTEPSTTDRPTRSGTATTGTHAPLVWLRAVDHPDLLAPATHAALLGWAAVDPEVADAVAVAEIDPDLADTAALTAAYDLPLGTSANCVVVSGRRAGEERIAAAVVLATTRADVNNAVKRLLDVRKASFLSTDRATAESLMEYGGITPVGLPQTWRVLVDSRVVVADAGASGHPAVIIGSGVRRSKLSLPGALLARLPGAEVVPDLALA
jgi:prolyl-tRNA editing enzyme YbaK/EbsC (Cys-tRNA(Pro) deacylase)